LRVIIDHLPAFPRPAAGRDRDSFDASLKALVERPQVYVKLSEIVQPTEGKVSADLGAYRDGLELIWGTFGEDRVLFGSDWPNCDLITDYKTVMAMAGYFAATRSREQKEKFYWRNSVKAYQWVRRDPGQPA
jgi:L-fuconolactonase